MFDGIALSLIGIAATVMVVGGIATLRSPVALSTALAASHRRVASIANPAAARVIGVAEIALGLAALVDVPGTAAGLGLVFVTYAWFTERAVRRSASCGCLGVADTPATRSHAVLDLVIGIAVVLAAWSNPPRPSWAITATVAALVAVGATSVVHLLRSDSSTRVAAGAS